MESTGKWAGVGEDKEICRCVLSVGEPCLFWYEWYSYLGGVKCNRDYGLRTLDKYTGMCKRKFHLEMQERCIWRAKQYSQASAQMMKHRSLWRFMWGSRRWVTMCSWWRLMRGSMNAKKECKKRWYCIVMCMAAAVMVQAEFVGGGALGWEANHLWVLFCNVGLPWRLLPS